MSYAVNRTICKIVLPFPFFATASLSKIKDAVDFYSCVGLFFTCKVVLQVRKNAKNIQHQPYEEDCLNGISIQYTGNS
ncbi:MAG: hypothetical protein GY749_36600 [Desulfobacteraceae bacterium]|nr:hypothetical protein [Desulfobacteraceae bacterium]